jgi:aminoglycoside phosphotransferase (APT) family kinase protein
MRAEIPPQSDMLARGRTAEVYAWGEGKVLKLFLPECPESWAQREARVTRAAHAAGLPVPATDDMIEVAGRPGIIFERIIGHSMVDEFKARPWRMLRLAATLAELQASMHDCALPGLPALHDQLARRIRELRPDMLSADAKEATLDLLDRLPDGVSLCHSDFHPENVLLTAHGPVILDWMTAAQGNPLADVARSALILQLRADPPSGKVSFGIDLARPIVRGAYLRRYFQLHPEFRAQFAAWLIPVAAARLDERIPGEQEQILALIEAGLRLRH